MNRFPPSAKLSNDGLAGVLHHGEGAASRRRRFLPTRFVELIRNTRCVRELLIERLPVSQTTSQELRPGRDGDFGIDLLRKKTPELGVVPAQPMLGGVAVLADAGSELLYFRHQLGSCKEIKVFVHIQCLLRICTANQDATKCPRTSAVCSGTSSGKRWPASIA